MAKKLYVGGLPYKASEAELQELFSQAGEVASAAIVMDKMTGRSRGFGFIEMATDEGAAEAIQKLNGADFQGRKLIVNEARPKPERSDSRF